mmetsp:Transcript_32800/g.99184  ORF Transcript_32800/g.99184 Transcript_32800/m.99184 type:complete len:262 (-) Transcript_32800:135-920(-)
MPAHTPQKAVELVRAALELVCEFDVQAIVVRHFLGDLTRLRAHPRHLGWEVWDEYARHLTVLGQPFVEPQKVFVLAEDVEVVLLETRQCSLALNPVHHLVLLRKELGDLAAQRAIVHCRWWPWRGGSKGNSRGRGYGRAKGLACVIVLRDSVEVLLDVIFVWEVVPGMVVLRRGDEGIHTLSCLALCKVPLPPTPPPSHEPHTHTPHHLKPESSILATGPTDRRSVCALPPQSRPRLQRCMCYREIVGGGAVLCIRVCTRR